MNVFPSFYPATHYHHSFSQHYTPAPPTYFNMNYESHKRKREAEESHDEESEDSMDEYEDGETSNEQEPFRKRRKVVHQMRQLQLQQPNQIMISLRGNDNQIMRGLPNEQYSLNDFSIQQQEYVRRKEYQHELEQKRNEERRAMNNPQTTQAEYAEHVRKYGEINTLLSHLHNERSGRSSSRQ
jgi:hypothetical protein